MCVCVCVHIYMYIQNNKVNICLGYLRISVPAIL